MKWLVSRSVFSAAILALVSCGDSTNRDEDVELVMFCAAGMKSPITRIAKQYEEEYGGKIRLQFGGSGTLLSNLQIAPGDIYLAADSGYTDEAKKRGLIEETMPVALMKAGFGVPSWKSQEHRLAGGFEAGRDSRRDRQPGGGIGREIRKENPLETRGLGRVQSHRGLSDGE